MNRASERAAELAKKRKATETKLLTATIEESNALALRAGARHDFELRTKQLEEAMQARIRLADELAELSKD